jgi:hypothetical protein
MRPSNGKWRAQPKNLSLPSQIYVSMSTPLLFDVHHAADGFSSYHNALLSQVNDHVIRVSVMTESFTSLKHLDLVRFFVYQQTVQSFRQVMHIQLVQACIELSAKDGFTVTVVYDDERGLG